MQHFIHYPKCKKNFRSHYSAFKLSKPDGHLQNLNVIRMPIMLEPIKQHETSHVLLAGVPGGFSRGSPVFAPPTDWSGSYELK